MTKVIVITLNELGEEIEKTIKKCNTEEEAKQFILEHEQEYTDNPEIYSVYIED